MLPVVSPPAGAMSQGLRCAGGTLLVVPMNNRTASRPSRHGLAQFEALERRALFSAGSLDPTFGQGGILHITDPQTLATTTAASAMQADGKTLLAGNSQTDAGAVGTLARLTASGGPDPTFGQGGLLTLSAPGYSKLQVGSLAVDPAGNILLAGRVISRHGVALAAVARLRADGSLDATFGDGGWAALAFGSQPSVNAIAVAPDGGILVGGSSVTKRTHEDLTVARLNGDGSVDGTFGKGGRAVVAFMPGRRHPGRANVAVEALAVQPDGEIVAVGGGDRAVIARLTPGGAVDSTFGNAGGVSLARRRERFTSVALADDGEIFAAGGVPSEFYGGSGASTHLIVAALTPGGRLDSAFGNGGEVVQFIGASHQRSSSADAAGIRLTADGKVLVAGAVQNVHTAGPFLERFNRDGSVDPTFATRGIAVFPAGGADHYAAPPTALALLADPDGTYVVPYDGPGAPFGTAGTAAQEREQLRATRFNADGSVDTTFGDNGLAEATGPLGPGYNAVDGVGVMPGGELAILGSTPDARFLAHADANGTLDGSFGQGGETVVPFDRAVMTPDGKWVTLTPRDLFDYGVTRYSADGTLDTTFGTNGYVRLGSRGSAAPPRDLHVRDDGSVVVVGFSGTDDLFSDSTTTLFVVDPSGRVAAQLVKHYQAGDSFGAFGWSPDGDVLAVVNTNVQNAPSTVAVAAYHADLTPDTSFGVNGVESLITLNGPPFANVRSLQAAPDGSVYVVTDFAPDGSTVIDRLTPAGQPDTAFASSGSLTLYGGLRPTLLVQPDGKLLLASTAGQTRTLTLTRYNVDGTLDGTFGTGGQATIDFGRVLAPRMAFAFQTVNGQPELLAGGQAYFGRVIHSYADVYTESDGVVARIQL